jgi:glycerol-3-phosphate acyltransferase PlsY
MGVGSGVVLGSAAYLLGSVPSGLLIVRIATGQDVRMLHSGRTGGTNVSRAAGIWAGVSTAVMDALKAAGAVWIARLWAPGQPWLAVLAGGLAILGHNYSLFLIHKTPEGLKFGGGAGGAPTIGAAFGLWAPSVLIILPLGALILFGLGYASVATLSVALISTGIFLLRALAGLNPWAYVAFGLVAEALLIWALRPNIRRLIQGNERLIGWRRRRQSRSGG